MAQRYSKITMAGFISLRLWKRGSGSVRHHVHTWIGLKPTENLWDTLEKIFHSSPTHPASIQDLGEKLMQLWAEINAPMFKSILKQRYGQCMLSSKFFSWLLGTEGVDQKFSFDWFFLLSADSVLAESMWNHQITSWLLKILLPDFGLTRLERSQHGVTSSNFGQFSKLIIIKKQTWKLKKDSMLWSLVPFFPRKNWS